MRDYIFIPEHKTKVLPLRWLANYIFHPISMFFFNIGVRYNDKLEWDEEYKWHNRFMEAFGFRLYKLFNHPYDWWGTLYKLEPGVRNKIMADIMNSDWNDYDERGIPYWDYWWHEDPETGDAWRIVMKENNDKTN